ncbi:MAG: sigma-70 family RNA polymerase sigma factor [Chloroflexi bacterium]|nr:MAG: sigma-70 family RNA polymerase sigma factor [Chloroflexota bacterium]
MPFQGIRAIGPILHQGIKFPVEIQMGARRPSFMHAIALRREPTTTPEDSFSGPMKPLPETNAPAFDEELLASIEAVHRFALQLARDVATAEDLVQETYLRALAHREQYTPGTNCRAWLFTICRNVFLKGVMLDAREVATENAELEAMGAAAVHGAVAASDPTGVLFERTDVDDAVRKALDKLPEDYRTVVALVDIEDQSYAAVAGILGIPVGTVRSRLFRGRRLLQQDLLAHAMDAGLIPARMEPKP